MFCCRVFSFRSGIFISYIRPSEPNFKTYYWQSKTRTKCSVNESIGAPTTYCCRPRVKNLRTHLPESAGTCAIYFLEFLDGAYISGKVTGFPRSWALLVRVVLQQVDIHMFVLWCSHSWARRLNNTVIIVVAIIVVATVHWVYDKYRESTRPNTPQSYLITTTPAILQYPYYPSLSPYTLVRHQGPVPLRTAFVLLLVTISIHLFDMLAINSMQGKPIPRELLLQSDTQYVPAPDFPTRTIDLYRIYFSISEYLPAFTYYAPALFQTWTQTHRLILHTSEPIR